MLVTEVNRRLQGFRFDKIIFVLQKKSSNFFQELFTTGIALCGNCKIIFTIAGSCLLVSSKIELFATGGFQL